MSAAEAYPDWMEALAQAIATGDPLLFATDVLGFLMPGVPNPDRLSQLDLRLTKVLRFGRTRVQAMFDVYNVFNADAVLSALGAYGPVFLRPAIVMGGRTFKFGGQVDF